jgi:uncharacterized membrane protein (UPF0136 family)
MIFTLGLLIVIGGLIGCFFTPHAWFVVIGGFVLMVAAWTVAGFQILKGHTQ